MRRFFFVASCQITSSTAIRSDDTGQRIPCFDSSQLITTLMYKQFPPGHPKQLESVKVNIGFPVVRTDGRSGDRSEYGQLITKFSGMAALPKRRSFICNYQRLTYHLPTFSPHKRYAGTPFICI